MKICFIKPSFTKNQKQFQRNEKKVLKYIFQFIFLIKLQNNYSFILLEEYLMFQNLLQFYFENLFHKFKLHKSKVISEKLVFFLDNSDSIYRSSTVDHIAFQAIFAFTNKSSLILQFSWLIFNLTISHKFSTGLK